MALGAPKQNWVARRFSAATKGLPTARFSSGRPQFFLPLGSSRDPKRGATVDHIAREELTDRPPQPNLLAMSFLDTIKAKVGNEVYLRIEKEAEKEVALAMQMPLTNENYEKNY